MMVNSEGRVDVNRRMFPRVVFPIAPSVCVGGVERRQEFAFLVFCEDVEAVDAFVSGLRVLCRDVWVRDLGRGFRGLGLGIGWGKKFGWGCFSAKVDGFDVVEPLSRGKAEERYVSLQSPLTSQDGSVYLVQGFRPLRVVHRSFVVRNVHSSPESRVVSAYGEGSQLFVFREVDYYPVKGFGDFAVGFCGGLVYHRLVDGRPVKALEASFLRGWR